MSFILHTGFEFDVPVAASTTYGFVKIKSALERYKELKNDLRVPFKFVTPLNDPDWPENISGIRLGNISVYMYIYTYTYTEA
jgi:hypothetical protein